MKSTLHAFLIVCLLAAFAAPVQADRNLALEMARQCKTELATHCHDVTPGEGRILSCLHAYSDRLSNECSETVAEAREQVKLLMSALSFVQSECALDFERLCKDVVPGEGRVLRCLEENDAEVSRQCKVALRDVGLKD